MIKSRRITASVCTVDFPTSLLLRFGIGLAQGDFGTGFVNQFFRLFLGFYGNVVSIAFCILNKVNISAEAISIVCKDRLVGRFFRDEVCVEVFDLEVEDGDAFGVFRSRCFGECLDCSGWGCDFGSGFQVSGVGPGLVGDAPEGMFVGGLKFLLYPVFRFERQMADVVGRSAEDFFDPLVLD